MPVGFEGAVDIGRQTAGDAIQRRRAGGGLDEAGRFESPDGKILQLTMPRMSPWVMVVETGDIGDRDIARLDEHHPWDWRSPGGPSERA